MNEVTGIRCPSCGDGGGMEDLMELLYEAWDEVYGFPNEQVHCPMCGKHVEVID